MSPPRKSVWTEFDKNKEEVKGSLKGGQKVLMIFKMWCPKGVIYRAL